MGSENYEAEKNNKEKLQCCFCEFSAHGCPIFKQQKISEGYVWFCRECRRMPNIFNLIFMVEERNRMANRIEELEKKDKISKDRIEELEKKDKISKDKKRKRNDSETIDNKKKNEPNEDEDKSKEEKNKIQEEKNKNEKNKTMPKKS